MRNFLSAVMALSMLACGAYEGELRRGTVEVTIPLEISDITDVIATVSAPDITPIVVPLAITGDVATGLIAGVPAGLDRTFSVEAFVGADLTCAGSSVASITAGIVVTVAVTLDCAIVKAVGDADVVADFNFPPEILYVTAAPSSVVVGGTVGLSVSAVDADGDALSYAWTATGGSFDVDDAAVVTWTAPAISGSYGVTIEVSDGTTTTSLTIIIIVTAAS